MADIFISYSQADRDLAQKLADIFQQEGFSVWWDRQLLAGDHFERRIREEINQAKAAVVIWTQTSVNSDYVQGETRLAKSKDKLVPIKSPKLGVGEIPFEFQNHHTENITEHDRILAAIERLVRNAPPPRSPEDAQKKNAERLFQELIESAKNGTPELVTYTYAFQQIFTPNRNNEPRFHLPNLLDIATSTKPAHLSPIGDVKLDTFIVSKDTGKPGQGHWRTTQYDENDWKTIFENSSIRR